MENTPADAKAMLERLAERSKGTFWEVLGCTAESVSPERTVVTLETEGRHMNGMGIVHGGVTSSLLDHTMGLAVLSAYPGRNAVTTNLNVHFVAPLGRGKLTTVASVLHASRSTVTVEGRVFGEDGGVGVIGTASFRLLE